jgi:hypothetical protein
VPRRAIHQTGNDGMPWYCCYLHHLFCALKLEDRVVERERKLRRFRAQESNDNRIVDMYCGLGVRTSQLRSKRARREVWRTDMWDDRSWGTGVVPAEPGEMAQVRHGGCVSRFIALTSSPSRNGWNHCDFLAPIQPDGVNIVYHFGVHTPSADG